MNKFFKTLVGIFIILVVVCLWLGLLVAIPLLAIWSVNTLFGLGIAYTVLNWIAAYVLITLFDAYPLSRTIDTFSK